MSFDKLIERGHARRAGRVENYFCILQRRKIYKNFGLVGTFNDALPSKEKLAACLRALVLRYPILAASIVHTDQGDLSTPWPEHDYVKMLDSLTFDQVFREFPDEIMHCEDKAEVLRQLNTIEWDYANETPMWQIGLLDDRTLVFLSNHVCSDGISGKNFFQELQVLLNDPSITDDNGGVLLDYNLDYKTLPELPPAIEEEVDYTAPWSFVPPYIFNLAVIKTLCFTGITATREDKHLYKVINIPPNKFQHLKDTLKSHNTPISPYLTSAWLHSFHDNLLQDSWLKLTDLSIPCDSRQFAHPGVELDKYKFGSNTAGNHFFHFPVKTHDWSTIGYFTKFFDWAKRMQNYLYGLALVTSPAIEKMTNLDKVIQDSTVGIKRTGSVMSNIGLFRNQDDGMYKIEDLLFSKNAGGTMFSFSLAVITTDLGGMNVVVSMAEGTTSKEKFEALTTQFEQDLYSVSN